MGSSIARVSLRFTSAILGLYLALNSAVFAACQPNVVDLKGAKSSARFTIELADTDETRSYGLMNRTSMANSSGMLFVYDTPGVAAFWMKNTLIPLDMIFLDAQGKVRHIHENAIPGDLTTIYGGDNIKAVLEINGGLSRRLRLAPGDVMRHEIFSENSPLWPCN